MTGPVRALRTWSVACALAVSLAGPALAQDEPELVLDLSGDAEPVSSIPTLFVKTRTVLYVIRNANRQFGHSIAIYRVREDGSPAEMILDARSPSTPLSIEVASPLLGTIPPVEAAKCVIDDTLLLGWSGALVRIDPTGPPRKILELGGGSRCEFAMADRILLSLAPEGATVESGRELWVSDGTTDGTVRLPIGEPGELWEYSHFFTFAGEVHVLVRAPGADPRDGVWWSTDGTPEGTRAVPGRTFAPDGALPTILGRLPGAVIASDWSDESGGRIWRTDGTREGTRVLLELPRLNPLGSPIEGAAAGEVVLFRAGVPGRGAQLWRTDGTTTGTRPVDGVEAPWFRALPTGAVVFPRTGEDGRQVVWRADGTDGGTQPLFDFGEADVTDGEVTSFQDGLIFSPRGEPGLFLVRDLGLPTARFLPDQSAIRHVLPDTQPNSYYPSLLVGTENSVWFGAWSIETSRVFLGVTDGTLPGTREVPLGTTSRGRIDDAVDADGRFFASIEHPVDGPGLVSVVPDVTVIADEPGTGRAVASGPLTALRDGVLFVGPRPGDEPDETTYHLRFADAGGSADLVQVAPERRNPWRDPVFEFGGRGYFRVLNAFGTQAWTTDGSRAGTRSLGIPDPGAFFPLGDDALVHSYDVGGVSLWRTSGGFGDGVRLATFPDVRTYEYAQTALGGHFVAFDPDSGWEVWRTDGTALGTRLFADIVPGPASSSPTDLAAEGDTLFLGIRLDPTSNDRTPHAVTSDGQVLEITDSIAMEPRWIANTLVELPNGRLFLRPASDGPPELWRTDGTTAGTVLVHRFDLGDFDEPASRGYALGDGRAVFRGADLVRGAEPWITDGTPAGTYPLIDLAPGPAGSFPADFALIDGALYFTADPTGEGVPTGIWRFPLDWIDPGVSPAPPPDPRPLPDIVPPSAPDARPLVVDDLKVKVDLTRISRDKLKFRFRLPVPEGGELEGQTIRIRLGDLDLTATLDFRGRARLADGDIKVKAKPVRSKGSKGTKGTNGGTPGGLEVTLRIRRANLLNALTRERLIVPFGETSIERPVLATVTRVGIDHANVTAMRYRSNARKGRGRLVD